MTVKVRTLIASLDTDDSRARELVEVCETASVQSVVGTLVRRDFERFSPEDLINFDGLVFAGMSGLSYLYVDFGKYGVVKVLETDKTKTWMEA